MNDDFEAGMRRAAEIVRGKAALYPVIDGVTLAAPSALLDAAMAIEESAGCERCNGGDCASCGGDGGICECGAPGGYCRCPPCGACKGSGVCPACAYQAVRP